jgi:Flp pilus assembly protein TadG
MHVRSFKQKQSERGAALILFTLMLITVALPMVGLAVDGGIVYFAHARLTAAVDAAALAGARSLNVGQEFSEQKTYSEGIASEYFTANFPTGLLGSSNVTAVPVATESADHTRQVAVAASANIGLYFLRLLGKDTATISASAVTSRRDVNVVLTLDRSGSMAHVCNVMKSDAENFVSKFTNGRDTVGLVTFMGSASVNFPSSKEFKPNLNDLLGTLNCGNNTGSAEALSLAHQQLLSVAQPGALNVIVFFTDGVPNGFTGDFPLQTGKSCTGSSIKVVRGYIADGGGLYFDDSQLDISSTAISTVPGCPSGTLNKLGQSYSYIPETDINSNSASATGYASVGRDGNGNIIFSIANSDAVSKNAADDAASKARNDGIFIYVIGLDGDGGVDGALLKRIANDPSGSHYDSAQPAGKYFYSPNAGQLGAAFNAIASEILRISR